jgi:hypothetical protein
MRATRTRGLAEVMHGCDGEERVISILLVVIIRLQLMMVNLLKIEKIDS